MLRTKAVVFTAVGWLCILLMDGHNKFRCLVESGYSTDEMLQLHFDDR